MQEDKLLLKIGRKKSHEEDEICCTDAQRLREIVSKLDLPWLERLIFLSYSPSSVPAASCEQQRMCDGVRMADRVDISSSCPGQHQYLSCGGL